MAILLNLRWFFRLYWRRYAVAIAVLLAIAGLVMVPPWLIGRLVDALAQQRLTLHQLLEQLGLIVGITLLVYGLRIMWRAQLYGASFYLASLLRSRIYNHLTLMAPSFYQQHLTGDLMARATNDVTAVEMTAGEAILASVDGVLTAVVVLAMMVVVLSWKLTLLALLPWPIMGFYMWRYGNELHAAFSDAQHHFSRLNDKTQESITGIRLIKSFGLQQQTLAAYNEVVRATGVANLRVATIDAKYNPTIFLTMGCSFLLAVTGGAWGIEQGEFTVGELTTFTMYLGYLIWPMFAFGWTLNLLERGSAAYARIEELLATPSAVADHGCYTAMAAPRLEFSIQQYLYPGRQQAVLHDLYFTVAQGATFGIVGPTGSGKSTLIGLLLRLYESDTAQIKLDGRPLAEYPLATLRRHFGLVPQDPFLFSATDIMRFPDHYQTLVGERGITLSGGQKQRIALARALLLDPPILVLDDALSAVDGQTESTILHHLKTARHGRTNIIVTHRLSAVVEADEIVVLHHGELVERGVHAALLTHAGWYAQMFRYQQIERSMEEGGEGG
ncbi:MAG: ATP-binding cassette subfamily B bacterial [Halothiobacillaceae bacterium]|nr:MAG: ATP-binding cassette subfamily B bacterial [Halothiobacillaceae bacterium]